MASNKQVGWFLVIAKIIDWVGKASLRIARGK